jgi:hypothetical protein
MTESIIIIYEGTTKICYFNEFSFQISPLENGNSI